MSFLAWPTAGVPYIFRQSKTPLTPSEVLKTVSCFNNVIAVGAPQMLSGIHKLGEEAIRQLADHTIEVIFGGAPMKKDIGSSLVAAGVNLIPLFGVYVPQSSY